MKKGLSFDVATLFIGPPGPAIFYKM